MPRLTIKAVTHPSNAHRDEFMACCLLIADGAINRIERRECTKEDLEDDNTYVLDQGGQLDAYKCNFDHHQLVDGRLDCTVSLIIESHFDLRLADAEKAWKWLRLTTLMDDRGPQAVARDALKAAVKDLGIDVAVTDETEVPALTEWMAGKVSPVEVTVTRWFAEHDVVTENHAIWPLMRRIGAEKLEYFDLFAERLHYLDENGVFNIIKDGMFYFDARCVDRGDEPKMAVEDFLKDIDSDVPITVTHAPRGGISLYARNNDKRFDFTQIKDMDVVSFAHKGGHFAVIADHCAPLPYIKLAMV